MDQHGYDREASIYRITLVGFFVNIALSVGKLVAGVAGHSEAMAADAVHSLSDFATDIVVLFFVKMSAKPKDADHEYGHGKFETLAVVLIGGALGAVGVGILANSVRTIVALFGGAIIPRPGSVALIAALVSIVAKEALYRATATVGKRTDSPAVMANAWHHRSDALSSVATLAGIAGARFLGESWRILDPLAAALVGCLVLKVAYELLAPGIGELLEGSLPKDTEEKILSIILEDPDVRDPHNLRTRRLGSNIAIEAHVRMDSGMSVRESHQTTEGIEGRLKKAFGPMTLVTIHVEPSRDLDGQGGRG